jgi:predicted glycosyltransferase
VKIWIDFSNSPHPLLFEPVITRLRNAGHEVALTARDNAQTVELARRSWPEVVVLGGESPGNRAAKAATIADRMLKLARWAAAERPAVALSHNSYAQIAAAAINRIPVVTAMDFEHQPVNHLAFRLARTVLVPDIIPVSALRHQGAPERKLIRYPGLKEELYIGGFEPDPAILGHVGIEKRPRTLVVARTPPSRAVYHASGNPLFDAALRVVCAQPGVVCVVLARHPEQRAALHSLGLPNCVVPANAIDSRSLMYAADVMIGAGGTMTREAALMGIPTWTLFAGRPPAVDVWLEREGRLSRLATPGQLAGLGPRTAEPRTPAELRERGEAIELALVDATLRAGAKR